MSEVPCFAVPGVVSSSAYLPPPAHATKNIASMGGWGVFQAQELLYKSFTELCTAIPCHVVGLWHFVEDVGIVYSDADGKPEHLLPGLVWFVRNEIPRKPREKEEVEKKKWYSAITSIWEARNNPGKRFLQSQWGSRTTAYCQVQVLKNFVQRIWQSFTVSYLSRWFCKFLVVFCSKSQTSATLPSVSLHISKSNDADS